jgi:hypothetical protein
MQMMIDGSTIGGAVGLGSVFLVVNQTFSYTISWKLSIEATGAGGTCTIAAAGVVMQQGANAGNLNANSVEISQPVSSIGAGKAYDTTASHNLKIFGLWTAGGGTGSFGVKTLRSKYARRM